MNDRTFVSVFTPSQTRPEVLETIFVQRHAMLDDTVERIHESATTGNKHHLLFVGSRGTGKTHLVTLLIHRLSQDSELEDRLRIAWLNEDETSTTLLELLRRIYIALGKRSPGEYTEASLEPLFDLEPDDAERWLARLLLKRLGNRTLLVIVENLDALFEGLGKSGQQKLRALIQENPVLTLVATAQRLIADISKRHSAFFGFFQTEHFKPLSVEQATELLQKIATLNGQPEVAAFLSSATGRSRVRALHHLSGGNHRIYIVLAQFITRESIDALVGPFTKMVDEMTPYYQERIRWLPVQQRKIVEYLCSCERPIPVKHLARWLFASQQTISSQLKDLRERGYVQAAQRGRESLYEIAEPLMRICVQVKENQSHEPLGVLVDFLRVWYDACELMARLQTFKVGNPAHAYLEFAIKKNQAQGNLRTKLLVEGLLEELGDERGLQWSSRIESYAQESEELALACGEWAKGNDTEALSILEEIADASRGQPVPIKVSALMLAAEIHCKRRELESEMKCHDIILTFPNVPADQVARALFNRGMIYLQTGDHEKAIVDFSSVIDSPNVPVEGVARALLSKGVSYRQVGDSEMAIANYSAVINLPNAPIEQVARALVDRSAVYLQLGDYKRAITDYGAVIDLSGAPVRQIENAFYGRGLIYRQLGDYKKAITDFSAVIKLPDASVEQVVKSLFNRGVSYGQLGEHDKEIADYNAAIKLPGVPVEAIANTLVIRGIKYGQLGEHEKAIADFDAVIDLPGVPVEQVADALFNRGVGYGWIGDHEKAIVDFSAVIELPGVSSEQVADALYDRGIAYWQLSEMEKSEKEFEAVLRLERAPRLTRVDSHFALSRIHMGDGRWESAVASLAEGLREGNSEKHSYGSTLKGIIGTFFDSSLTPKIRRDRVCELLSVFQDHNAIPSLGEALTQHLGLLYASGEDLPAMDNLESWASVWEEAGKDIDAFQLPLRIFRAGIDFLKSGGRDRGIFLDLNKEERNILEQALNLEPES